MFAFSPYIWRQKLDLAGRQKHKQPNIQIQDEALDLEKVSMDHICLKILFPLFFAQKTHFDFHTTGKILFKKIKIFPINLLIENIS